MSTCIKVSIRYTFDVYHPDSDICKGIKSLQSLEVDFGHVNAVRAPAFGYTSHSQTLLLNMRPVRV